MPSLYTKISKFRSRSWIVLVLGPFRIFNILATYYSIYSLQISTIAFFTAFTHYITVGKGIYSLAIYRYAPNTNKVNIKLFRPVVLLKALNAIYRTISLLIPSSLITII